jgi:hypothetical protein
MFCCVAGPRPPASRSRSAGAAPSHATLQGLHASSRCSQPPALGGVVGHGLTHQRSSGCHLQPPAPAAPGLCARLGRPGQWRLHTGKGLRGVSCQWPADLVLRCTHMPGMLRWRKGRQALRLRPDGFCRPSLLHCAALLPSGVHITPTVTPLCAAWLHAGGCPGD